MRLLKKFAWRLIYILELLKIKFAGKSSKAIVAYSRKPFFRNLGDDYNKPLFKHFITKGLYFITSSNYMIKSKIILGVGSILDDISLENSVVIGSGFLRETSAADFINSEFLVLRGILTYNKLCGTAINSKVFLSDPGILISRIFPLDIKEKKFKYGIIPHYSDKKSNSLKALKKLLSSSFIEIDIQTKDFSIFTSQINSCEIILSSTLHGLIFADSYGIPNCWISLSNNLVGGDFKFHDYFSSIDRLIVNSLRIDSSFKESDLAEYTTQNNLKTQIENLYSILGDYFKNLN